MYVKFSAFCDLLQKQIRKTRNQCANIVLIRSRFIYSPFALNHIHTHSFYFWHCYYCTWLFFFFLIPLEPCAFYFARDLLLCDSEWRFALESDTIDGTVSFCSSTRYQEKFKLCISSNSKFSYEICILWWKKIRLKSSHFLINSFDFFIFWYREKNSIHIFIPKCVYVIIQRMKILSNERKKPPPFIIQITVKMINWSVFTFKHSVGCGVFKRSNEIESSFMDVFSPVSFRCVR